MYELLFSVFCCCLDYVYDALPGTEGLLMKECRCVAGILRKKYIRLFAPEPGVHDGLPSKIVSGYRYHMLTKKAAMKRKMEGYVSPLVR